jgi:hypothetical protein
VDVRPVKLIRNVASARERGFAGAVAGPEPGPNFAHQARDSASAHGSLSAHAACRRVPETAVQCQPGNNPAAGPP